MRLVMCFAIVHSILPFSLERHREFIEINHGQRFQEAAGDAWTAQIKGSEKTTTEIEIEDLYFDEEINIDTMTTGLKVCRPSIGAEAKNRCPGFGERTPPVDMFFYEDRTWSRRNRSSRYCYRAEAGVPRPQEARRTTTAELIERQSSVWRMELGPAVRG